MTTPSEHLARVYALLVETYGEPKWEPDYDPLGGLIGTILSQHTSDKKLRTCISPTYFYISYLGRGT